MMMEAPSVVLCPTPAGTLVLLRWGQHERLKALLPPALNLHPSSAPLLLEGLAHGFQQRLSIALCVDAREPQSDLGLCNSMGGGVHTLHYQVEVVELGRRGIRLHGIPGDFARLRRLAVRRYA